MESHKNTLLIAFASGLLISDIVPTPADGLYFYLQQKNKQKLEEKEITPKQYWTRDALAYYGLNPLWWGTILGISFLAGKNFAQKRNIFIGLVAGGIVVGVLSKNIKKDEAYYKLKQDI